MLTLDVTILDVMLHVVMYVICVNKFKNDKLMHSLMNKSYFGFIRTTANRRLYSRLSYSKQSISFYAPNSPSRDRQACCNVIENIWKIELFCRIYNYYYYYWTYMRPLHWEYLRIPGTSVGFRHDHYLPSARPKTDALS